MTPHTALERFQALGDEDQKTFVGRVQFYALDHDHGDILAFELSLFILEQYPAQVRRICDAPGRPEFAAILDMLHDFMIAGKNV